MKYLIILIVLIESSFSENLIFNYGECPTNPTNLDYNFIMLSDISDNQIFDGVDVFACNGWRSAKVIYNPSSSFTSGTFVTAYENLDLSILNYVPSSNSTYPNETYAIVVQDSGDDIGLIYGDSELNNTYTMPTSTFTNINSQTFSDLPSGFVNASTLYAYIIGFDNFDPYAGGYTSSELVYDFYFTDTDGNILDLIRDNDRNNELVGFKFNSSNNSTTYTHFVKPNN